jgi:hypothetical protein
MSITQFPDDIIGEILGHLDPWSVGVAVTVCRNWADMAHVNGTALRAAHRLLNEMQGVPGDTPRLLEPTLDACRHWYKVLHYQATHPNVRTLTFSIPRYGDIISEQLVIHFPALSLSSNAAVPKPRRKWHKR